MVENLVRRYRVWLELYGFEIEVLDVDFSVFGKAKRNFLGKPVDELVFVDFIVCLLVGVHILSKQTF